MHRPRSIGLQAPSLRLRDNGRVYHPRQAFCNRYVTIVEPEGKYRILGHPICIKDEKYERNEFMFNFCIAIGVEVDKIPYEAVVRRLASTFTEMEIQNQFLSQEDVSNSQDRRSIAALIEIIKEDLNNYNECMIPVGTFNLPFIQSRDINSSQGTDVME